MTKDEALRMALEALEADPLEMVADVDGHMVFLKDKAITAIKEALAQPEQDNTYAYASSLAKTIWQKHYIKESPKFALLDTTEGVLTQIDNMTCGLVREKPAQPEQEPLAWISTGPARMIHWTADKPAYCDDWVPLYTTPPQRTWVGLTKEEIAEFDTWHDNREEEVGWCNPSEIVAYIEAKLKDKNGY